MNFDDDFLALVAEDRLAVDHAGIMFVQQHGLDVGDVVDRVDTLLAETDEEDLAGRILYA